MFVDPWKRWKKAGKILLAIFALYLLFVVIVDWVIPTWYWFRADSIVQQFQKNPTPKLAQASAYLLDRKLLPEKQGGQILQLLTYPNICINDATKAKAGREKVLLRQPYSVRLRDSLMMGKDVIVTGSSGYGRSGSLDERRWHDLEVEVTASAMKSGVISVRYDYSIRCPVRGAGVSGILNRIFHSVANTQEILEPTPSYECNYTVIVDLNVMNANE